ncbi:MAG: DUF6519 domain-containing protein, partial [Candidatus Nitrosopolaris sp.]
DESNGILSVNSTGRDSNLGFVNQLWVEINDDRRELAGMPGSLIQILDVDQNNNTIKFDPNSVIGDHITEANFPKEFNPKIRRWDGSVGLNAASVPATNFGYVKLENGIEVKFENGTYATGDYWLIRASTATGDIEWVNNEYEMQWSHLTDTDQSTLKDFLTSFGVDWVVEFAVDPNNSNSIVGKSADSTHAVSVQLNNDNTEATLYIDNNITFTFPVTSQANDLVLHAETPQPLSPVGIKHHFARLAVLSYGSTGVIVVQDCRNFFSTAIISQQPSQPANANTGLIKLHVQSDLTLYGPFLHYIKDLIAPPAILLGLAGKEVLGQVGLTEDWALYQFGERQPLFKPYDITVDSFRIHYEHLGAQETTMLRWWAIPALNQPDQTNVPIITISPAGGPAGTQAKVAGTYFSGSTVKLIHGSSALTDANIDDRGSFSITFQIPTDLSNGAFRITATDNSPGNLSASATFTIGPVVIEGLSSSAKSTSIGRTATRKGHAKKTKE